jgi:hypothetical protein
MRKHMFKLSQLVAASQVQTSSSQETGPIKPERRALVHATRNPVLTIYMLLTLALLGISLGAYLRSRPNTGGAASADPFDGDRGFADFRQIVAFGPRPSSSPALERCTAFIIGANCAAPTSR